MTRSTTTVATDSSGRPDPDASGAEDLSVLAGVGLVVRHPGFTLGPVDLAVPSGRMVALIGPNGSGKTTLLECLVGTRRPDEGEARRFGRPVPPLGQGDWSELGYVADETEGLPPELTARELWSLHATAHAATSNQRDQLVARAAELADLLSLGQPPDRIATFSHGMAKKAQLVAELLHDPPLLVLDEPTNGLDPMSAHQVGTVLEDAGDRATLVATHDLAWAERFSDRVMAMVDGVVAAQGPTAELLGTRGARTLLDQFMHLVGEPT